MPRYSREDSYEREPLESSRSHYDSPAQRSQGAYEYSQPGSPSPFADGSPGQYQTPPPEAFDRARSNDPYNRAASPFDHYGGAPPPPRHGDNSYYNRGAPAHGEDTGYDRPDPHNTTPGADNFSGYSSGGTSGIAYSVADRNPREGGMDAARSGSGLPPPPSRVAQGGGGYPGGGGYMYDGYGRGAGSSAMRSQASSLHSYGYATDPYADDPYQAYSSSNRSIDRRLGEVNPNEIEDDGDDGLNYHKRGSQRNSMLSSAATSDRGARQGVGAAAAVGGAAAAGGAMGGLMSRRQGGGNEYNLADQPEKAARTGRAAANRRKKKWIAIIVLAVIISAIVVGGVVGGIIGGRKHDGSSDGSKGDSAEDDTKKNGDLSKDSDEIKELLNNPDLHKVFPGMDYTPLNSQYPDCMHNPPSQNNITRDVAVLSQLTNKIRLYGTDCNQTQMVVHAIDRLDLKDDIKIWLGVWQDGNKTTNARQLSQMWDVLDEYGDSPFEGLIVANEILFREEMDISELGDLLAEVRTNLTDRSLDLPVATSDLGDDWTSALASKSDYLMSNIHPFFAGVAAEKAASWTMSFWENNNSGFFKKDNSKNIISETGWPTGGGKNCGSDEVTNCSPGSVAGVDELNTFMSDFVCPALKNGTNYFWFSAFDEPWKVRFNEKGKEWEDKWGLMDVDRNLKKGVEIPDCDGQTVS